ncbi:hypothetical protein [Chitinophaga caseinilytica]|uniref:hypothetical protein n=1 Tax=Chitinophaga caseinilytica TaxID=2267521 RepID=UPI003C3041AE
MKKIFVIFLSVLYVVLASGFTRYAHVCKRMAIQTFSLTDSGQQDTDRPCPICASKEKDLIKKKKGCCQHEAKLVKVDEGIKKYAGSDLSVKFWGDAVPNKTLGTVFDLTSVTGTSQSSFPHPLSQFPARGNPLYILHCTYRI